MVKLMKSKNYERRKEIIILLEVFFLAILGLIIYTIFHKIPSHYLIKGVVFKDNLLEVIVSKKELQTLYKNGSLYIDDKKYKYAIDNVILDALKKDKKSYNIAYISCNLSNEKENDIIDLVFVEERIYLFEIFKLIWKGD